MALAPDELAAAIGNASGLQAADGTENISRIDDAREKRRRRLSSSYRRRRKDEHRTACNDDANTSNVSSQERVSKEEFQVRYFLYPFFISNGFL
jgi:hypothetical protein